MSIQARSHAKKLLELLDPAPEKGKAGRFDDGYDGLRRELRAYLKRVDDSPGKQAARGKKGMDKNADAGDPVGDQPLPSGQMPELAA